MIAKKLAPVLVVVTLAIACRSATQHKDDRKATTKNYNDGLSAFEEGDYERARELLTAAINAGWLGGESDIDARLHRVIALAQLKRFDEALAEIESLNQSPASPARVLSALSFVLEQQGKTKEAKDVWNRARRIDREVERFGN